MRILKLRNLASLAGKELAAPLNKTVGFLDRLVENVATRKPNLLMPGDSWDSAARTVGGAAALIAIPSAAIISPFYSLYQTARHALG